MSTYRVFTIKSGTITEGTTVEKFTLKGAGATIPAVLIGEEGRGRELGVLPAQLLPAQQKVWEEKGSVTITAAEVGQTRAGRPKLIANQEADTDEKIITVLRTKIGFRGGNFHTGDRAAKWWGLHRYCYADAEKAGIPIQNRYTAEEVREYSPRIMEARYPGSDPTGGRWDAGFERKLEFTPFPGEILVEGHIAQGAAGGMGSGSQLIAVMSKDIVFRTSYSGRLYGAPAAHYYVWTGEKLLSATWEERQLADLF